jgi:hypothetical protein
MRRTQPERRAAAALLIVLFCASVASPGVFGQDRPAARIDPSSYRLNTLSLSRFTRDVEAALSAPGGWTDKDWLRFAAAAGVGFSLLAADASLYRSVQEHKTPFSRDASSVISKIGNGAYLAGFIGLLYLGGEAFDKTQWRRTAWLGLESFAATTAVIFVLKAVLGRARPYTHEGSFTFHPFSFQGRYTSFASGDAAGAFSVASVVAAMSDGFFVDALAYGLAGLAAFWRVHDSKHWPSDVFVGSILGLVIGKKIVALDEKSKGGGVSLDLAAPAGYPGLGLSLRF